MKTFKTFRSVFLLTASIILVTSCNKDDAPANNTSAVPANSSFVTGKVDGAAFSSIIFGTSTASCSRSGTGIDAVVTVLGGDLAANSITVLLYGNVRPGTYTVNNNTDSLLNYTPSAGQFAYSTGSCDAATGTITITVADDTHVEGTFSFVGKDVEDCNPTKTVTEGTFKGIYPSS